MPIYEYQPLNNDGTAISWEDAKERRCCFFEFLSLFKEEPFDKCPSCGGAVGRAPSRFAARVGWARGQGALQSDMTGVKRTVEALKSEGLGSYAEAWADACAEAGKGWRSKGNGAELEQGPSAGQAPAVRQLIEGHVCTNQCKH